MIRTMQLALLLLLLAFSSQALAGDDCENESNWSAARSCAERQQMAELEAVYKDVLIFVGRDNAKAAEFLKQAQSAWLDFANKSCEFTVASRLPDSNDLRFGCWQVFVKARIKMLLAYKREHGQAPNDLVKP